MKSSPTLAAVAPYLWMLGGSASFAVMGVLTGVAGHSLDWQLIAVARTFLALLLALALALSAGAKLVFFKPRTLWMRSIAGSISLVGNFYALTQLPVSDVLTVTNMFPLWVAILSWPLLGDRPAADTWIAAIIGICGVALVQQPHFEHGGLALAAATWSSFTSAIALIGLHRLHGVDARSVVAHFSGVSLAFCCAAWLLFARPHQNAEISTPGLALLVGIGLSATAGQLLLTKAFAAGPPARVSVVNLSQVGFAALIERFFFGREFSATTLLGMVLVLAPTAWILFRRLPARAVDRVSD